MHITNHAEGRMLHLARVVGQRQIAALRHKLHSVPANGDHALVLPLEEPVRDPNRRQWSKSDHLAAIVRNGRVVSVMLTRKNQCHPAHFRVGAILQREGSSWNS